MHNTLLSSSGIDQDSHLAHDNSYSQEQWVDMSAYTHMPMPTYGTEYMAHGLPPVSHGLPSESIGRHMGPPPVPSMFQNNYASQIPHPLIIPSQQPAPVQWPSLQTNPSHSYSAPPVAIPSASAPLRQPPRLPTLNTSQPRRTLTDEDRRNMCKFHEENPHVKQQEIGAKFGVERSTVSKVLRKKDQYLNLDDRSGSPIKKNKGKAPPDIERALANWVRSQQKKGVVVSDYEMEEKAKVFCTGSDSPLKAITASWIEKFKQKQGLGPGKLIRRASETAIPDSTRLDRLDRLDDGSPLLSAASQTSGGISPASPAAPQAASSPQPSSANGPAVGGGGKDATAGSSSGFMDFESSSASAGAYRHPHSSQSTTSLSSGLTDPPSSTFSAGAFSPSSQQFTFSPDPNTGLFGGPGHGSANFQRPRSQTVPNIEPLEYLNGGGGPPLPHPQQQREEEDRGEPLTPRYSASGTAPSSALESPAHELAAAPPFGVLDAAISPPQHHALHHASSSSSLAGRSSAASGAAGATATATATGGGGGGGGGAGGSGSSGPGSPTQEDARRAADTLLSFMQHQGTGWLLDQNEYLIFVRLAEKLGLGTPQQQQQQQQQHQHVAAPKASSAIQGLGGLSRIPEGDIEMANTHTHSPLLKREEGPMN